MFDKDGIVAFAAIVGALLGIFNFSRSLFKDRVRLKIIPKAIMEPTYDERLNTNGFMVSADHFQNFRDYFALDIINLSSFQVTVVEVGLKSRWGKSKLTLLTPILPDGGSWPRDLRPRKSVLVYIKLSSIIDIAMEQDVKLAYARTACNHVFYGKSKALKLLKNYIKR